MQTGFIAWMIARFLDVPAVGGVSFAWLIVLVPLLWIAGINFGYFLGRYLNFFNQFGRYAAVGFTNAVVDFGVLYLLIWLFQVSTGFNYIIFKTISFVVAVTHSYFWNKHWVFDDAASRGGRREMVKFFAVNVAAAIVNVTVASVIVNTFPPVLGMTAEAWAGFGAVIGSATALAFSFVGFRLLVFKK